MFEKKFRIAVKELHSNADSTLNGVLNDALTYDVITDERHKFLKLDYRKYGESLYGPDRAYLIFKRKLKDIPDVAKRNEINRLQYQTRQKQLIQEVQNIAPLRHTRLIRLLGIVEVASVKAWFRNFELIQYHLYLKK